jgi:acetamidase/formamidase
MSGDSVGKDAGEPTPHTVLFTASPVPAFHSGSPVHHEFVPTIFYRQFSPLNKPVLIIRPLDTVHTTTVDAGGTDENGKNRSMGGNPQTGPFYVEGALPGDTLVVHINKLRLNRNWAISDDDMVERSLGSHLAITTKDTGKSVRWHLDLARGLASPEDPGVHMKSFSLPVHPMLGCVATAVGQFAAPPPTGDSGSYGGNMDFNELGDGATLYLPVSNPGALLYLGDAHALQGDGEINGNALETSMDVDFSVDLTPYKRIDSPRVETSTHVIAMGLAGSIDDAFREATTHMANWLQEDYGMDPSEIAEFIGVAAEYRVSEVADRNAGVVLKIDKSRIAALTKMPAPPASSH